MKRRNTLETIAEQRSRLGELAEDTITRQPVQNLRKVAISCGLSAVERGTGQVLISRARKSELVTALLAIAEQERQLKNAVVLTTDTEAGEVLAPVYEPPNTAKVAAYINSVSVIDNSVLKELTILAHEFIKQLAVFYPDTSKFSRATVRCARRSDYFNEIKRQLDVDDIGVRAYNEFRDKALAFGAVDTQAKVAKTNAANDSKIEAQVGIRTSALLAWSKRVLEATEGKRWKEVVVALAFVTGRRMNEVVAETEFTYRSEFTIDCKYLSKGRGKEQTIEGITTLVPAALVIENISWLESKGKRNYLQSEVNRKMGKELSQTTASLVAALDIVDADKRTTEQANGRKVNVFSFHSLRKAYILNAVKALPETRGTLREAQRLLGHSSLSTTNDNYKDVFYLID
jgi:hypothetical protein